MTSFIWINTISSTLKQRLTFMEHFVQIYGGKRNSFFVDINVNENHLLFFVKTLKLMAVSITGGKTFMEIKSLGVR